MKKVIDALFKVVEILISVFLGVMIVLVFMNVVLRYIFNKGFVWSEEIARLCFIYLVYFGSISAARDNRHLLIDSLLLKFSSTVQKIIYTVIQLCIIWLMYIVTMGSWGLMVQNFNDRWVATQFPTWLVYLSGFILGLSIIIISAINIFRLFVMKVSVSDLVQVHDNNNDELPTSVE